MKTCRECSESKPETEFSLRSKTKPKRVTICKACVRARSAKHYAANQEMYLERNRSSNPRTRKTQRLLITAAKGMPCMDCGEMHPHPIMEFDHRDRTTKVVAVSDMPGRYGNASIAAEIAKCDVVCTVCHRYRTHGNGKKNPYIPN